MVAGKNDNEEITELFTKVGRIQFILLGSIIVSGFVVFGKQILLGFGRVKRYEDAYIITMLLISTYKLCHLIQYNLAIQRAAGRRISISWLSSKHILFLWQ